MVNTDQGRPVGVQMPSVTGVGNDTEGMGDHGYLRGVLAEVLGPGIAHQGPALYIFHSRDGREKTMGLFLQLFSCFSCCS